MNEQNTQPNNIQPTTESKAKELLKRGKQYIATGLGGVALTTAAIGGIHAAENDNAPRNEAVMITPSASPEQVPAQQNVEPGTVLVDAPNPRREAPAEPAPTQTVEAPAAIDNSAETSHDKPKAQTHEDNKKADNAETGNFPTSDEGTEVITNPDGSTVILGTPPTEPGVTPGPETGSADIGTPPVEPTPSS